MTYASLLSREGVYSQYLIVMKPRRLITAAWTNVSGNIYRQSFTLGQVVALLDDGVARTEAASSSVGANEWFYDVDTSMLFINIGGDPAMSEVIVTYEIYFGTFDAHWYRDPLDDESRVVYYEPLVTKSPQITNSTSNLLFGFMPTFAGSITISNATKLLQEHVYASSFNYADILIYHYLDELTVDNTKLVLRGFCRDIESTDNDVTFSILDATSFFETQYRNPVGPSFYSTSMFPSLDPQYQARPLRRVFGVVEGFVPVNIDYVATGGVSSDNRRWVCLPDDTNTGTVSTTVKASPASTTTRTYLTSVTGFRVGDSWWNRTSTAKYGKISVVGADYIEHDALGVACSSGDTIERSFVGIIHIRQSNVIYELWYGRDYQEYIDSTNHVIGFDLDSIIPPANELSPSDLIVYCRIYGHPLAETISAAPFGAVSTTTGNDTNSAVILYHLLKTCLGLTEAQLNTDSFSDVEALLTDEIGFAVPKNSTEDFPTYKDLIIEICQSSLLKFFLDFDNTWKVAQTGPLGAVTKTIEDDEILIDSFLYTINYQEILSLVLVDYAHRQVSALGEPSGLGVSTVTATSTIAENLHNVSKQKSFKSLHFVEADAQTLADRLSFYFGDRRGVCRINTKNRFFDTDLDHVINVTRSRLPGFEFDTDTDRDREFAVESTQKSLNGVLIDLDDQKGIQDNEGDW